MSSIVFNDVSLKLRIYKDQGLTIKEAFVNMFKKSRYSENKHDLWVLKNINIEINKGDRLGIIGLNGAGKSSFLKLISKIYTPTEGTIDVSGKVVPLIELGAGFNPELTGRENIYLNGAILGFTKKQMKEIESKIIDFSELNEFIDMPIKYYSTGMYGRLAFAVATEVDADILLIDEIFAGGDVNFIDKAVKRMNNLIDNANIVVMVSHSLDLIKEMCNRCIVIGNHAIMYDGTPDNSINFYLNHCKDGSI